MMMKHHLMHFGLLSLLTLSIACTKDIRPDSVEEIKGSPSGTTYSKAQTLMADAARSHGVDALKEAATYRVWATDTWVGLSGMMFNPWPDSKMEMILDYRVGSFDGRAKFLSGEKKGWTWGVQSWQTYEVDPQGTLAFRDNEDAKFILPAIQYLGEFVLRAQQNMTMAYAGEETIEGKKYERVFLTWNSMEPTTDHDQYMVYIDPKTGLVNKIYYTVRDVAKFVSGTIHFDDFREIKGLKYPFVQSITFDPDDDPNDYAHRIVVTRLELGVLPLEAFQVNPKLATVNDAKRK